MKLKFLGKERKKKVYTLVVMGGAFAGLREYCWLLPSGRWRRGWNGGDWAAGGEDGMEEEQSTGNRRTEEQEVTGENRERKTEGHR